MTGEREIVRCDKCQLNQFRTANGNCRKCRMPLPVAEPEPTGVKIEVVQPAEIQQMARKLSLPQAPREKKPRKVSRVRQIVQVAIGKASKRGRRRRHAMTAFGTYQAVMSAGTPEQRRQIIQEFLNS